MRLLTLGILLTACKGGPATPTDPDACVPNADVFDANIAPILVTGCSECHGATPAFGAPHSLVTYDDMMQPSAAGTRADATLAALLAQSMPPSNATALSHRDLDTLVGWTSCGVEHPPTPDSLIANRPIFVAGDDPPEGTTPLDLTVPAQSIGPNVLDDYRAFTFRDMVTSPKFIRRIEPVLDDTRVLHHITLTVDGGYPYYYAWAPGTGPIQFPDGGIRLDPSTVLQVEIHYNNGAGVTDAVDSSGVRLYLDEPTGTEYGVASPQNWNINVPANGTDDTMSACTATMDFTVHAAMPHMHEIGSSFSHDVIRADGTRDSIIELSGWSFESQFIYETDVQIQAGERLELRCRYTNPYDHRVTAGLGTSEEMCFDFIYVTPAAAATQCPSPF